MSEVEPSEIVYKICPRAAWEAALVVGVYKGSAVDERDGFIHFSGKSQVAQTLHKHFAGQRDLVLVSVDGAALGPALRYEVSRGGALFPHLYGELPTALALSVESLPSLESALATYLLKLESSGE